MEESGGKETIDVEEARTRMGTDLNLLDIRPDEEWQTVGNIPGAVASSEEDASETVKQIDEDSTVVVVCEDGERSVKVAEALRESGRDAVSLEGGMSAWVDNDMPMQPTEDPALASDPGSVEDESSSDESESADEDEDGDGSEAPPSG